MQTRYLETLIMALECGSFSRAAETLHITQSAVSQRVKFLEEHFGQVLVDRSGPTLVATQAGCLVRARAQEILALEAALRDELKRFSNAKRLSLCCTPTFGMAFLPAVLNDFMRRHSDMADFKFIFQQPEQALKGLQERLFDLVVIEHCDEIDLSAFERCPLADDELIFVSAPVLGLPAGEITLAALLRQRIYARRDGCSSKELLRRNLVKAGVNFDHFQGLVISDDLQLTIQSVEAGGGISFVSRNLVAGHLLNGRLLAHSVATFTQRRYRSVVRPRQQHNRGLVEEFLHSLATVLAATGEAPQEDCLKLFRAV